MYGSPQPIPPVLDMLYNEDYVACQPLIRNDTDPELFEYAGAAGGFIDRDGFTFCAGRMFEVFETDHGQYNANREVFWASGAALFIKAEAWREVSGLDEDFFAHMEEIDLCWRLKNRGYRVGAWRFCRLSPRRWNAAKNQPLQVLLELPKQPVHVGEKPPPTRALPHVVPTYGA